MTKELDLEKRLKELERTNGKRIKELEEQNRLILKERNAFRKQVMDLNKRRAIKMPFAGKHLKIGIISDTHKGSLYENPNLDTALINYFNKEKVDYVFHVGDLIDGEKMYRGHEYEIAIHGADSQLEHFVKNFPHVKSKCYFITGSHDLAYWKSIGLDIGKRIEEQRDDFKYLGQEQAMLEIRPNVKIALVHPGGGTAYAVSYKSQKLIESFSGGQKPNVLLCGHYHKFDYLHYRNIHTFQVPTTQSQTPFMARKPTPAIMGGLVLDIYMDKKGISKLKTEYLPYYEK